MRVLAIALFFSLVQLSNYSLAQTRPTLEHAQVSLVVAIEAQYRAAIVRDRGLADERELRLIAEAEARMREARRVFVAAQQDRQAAERALEAARADYLRLINEIEVRDAAIRVEIEAFRAEVEDRLPQATPDLLSAYRQFADGDRADAWTMLDALLRASAEARLVAARTVAASEIRQLASLREIMRVNGEATAASVIALREQVVALDGSRFWDWSDLFHLHLATGDLQSAQRTAQRSFEAAADIRNRSIAYTHLGDVAERLGDLSAAAAAYAEVIRIRRARVAEAPLNVQANLDLFIALTRALRVAPDLNARSVIAREGVNIMRRVAAADPRERRELAAALNRLGMIEMNRGNAQGAHRLFEEEHAIFTALQSAAPSDQEATRDLSISHLNLGDALLSLGQEPRALNHYETSLRMRRRMSTADPSNITYLGYVGEALLKIGDLHFQANRISAAGRAYEELLPLVEESSRGVGRLGHSGDLSIVHERLGNVASQRRQHGRALEHYNRALLLREEMRRGLPDNAVGGVSSGIRYDIAAVLNRIGDVHVSMGNARAGLSRFEEARAMLDGLDLENVMFRRAMVVTMQRLADANYRLGDSRAARRVLSEALVIAERSARLFPTNAQLQLDLQQTRTLMQNLDRRTRR